MRRAGLEFFLHRCHISLELRDTDGLWEFLTVHELLYREQVLNNDHGRGGDGGTGDVANREGGDEEGAELYCHLRVPRDSLLESDETIHLSPEENSAQENKKKKKKGGLLMSWFGRGAKLSLQREIFLSPDDQFFESLENSMFDLEKAMLTVLEEAYALGAVRSYLSVGWYNFVRYLMLIRTADGAREMGTIYGLMGVVICAATTSRRRSGITAAGSKSKNRPDNTINDYMIGCTFGHIDT